MSATSAANFRFIDLLRGVAALLVVWFHLDTGIFHGYPAREIAPDSFTYWFVLGHFDLGKFAVALFFMVSGFLIPATLRNGTLREFAIHRLFRLYPAYWISILVLIAASMLTGRALDWSNVLVNSTMLQKFVGVPDVIGAYWTLQIELIFYATCAALAWLGLLDRRSDVIRAALILALVGAALRFLTSAALPVALFVALALMFLGDTIRAHLRGDVDRPKLRQATLTVALMLVPICLLAYPDEALRYLLTYWAAMAAFFGACALREAIAANRALALPVAFFADCSYSVYLLHDPVGLTLGRLAHGAGTGHLVTAVVTFAATLMAAYLCFLLVERPCIRVGRRIGAARRSSAAMAARMATSSSGERL